VYVYFDLYANGITVTRFAGEVSLTNGGEIGQNGILRDVSLTITAGKQTFQEYWFAFAVVSRRTTQLVVEPKESAHPLLVNGGGSVSQLITSSPRERDCDVSSIAACNETGDYISDITFLQQLSPGRQITLKFTGTTFDSKKKLLESSCRVSITDDFITKLAENDWYAARCKPVSRDNIPKISKRQQSR
jgi:hypothetical protein